MCKALPASRRGLPDRVFAGPELHHVVSCVRLRPVDAYGVELLSAGEIEDDPLRVYCVVFPGKGLRKIRIALPERLRVAVGETRIADRVRAVIAGDTAPRQWIAEGVHNRFLSRTCITGEVALLTRAAPGAVRIPVPGLGVQLGVLPVGDRLPAGGQHAP